MILLLTIKLKTKKITCLVQGDEWKEEEWMQDRSIQQHQTLLQTAQQCQKPSPQHQQLELKGCVIIYSNRCPLGKPNASTTVPQKWVKDDLHFFHQNVARLSLLKEYFPFFTRSAVRLQQLAKWEHCQIFNKIWGNFPISPKTRQRGEESNHGILIPRNNIFCMNYSHVGRLCSY